MVNSTLKPLCARATATDRAARYATAAELGRALREVQHSQTFQRRAQADGASIQESMKTVAIQFSMDNPYTAPDIPQTAAGMARRAHGAYQASNESQSVEEFSQASFEQDSTAMFPAGERGQEARPTGDDSLASAPTEMMNAPRMTRPVPPSASEDRVASAPTEMMNAPRMTRPVRASASEDLVATAPTEMMNAPQMTRPDSHPAGPATAPQAAVARDLDGDDSLITRTRTFVANAFRKREPSQTKSGPVKSEPVKSGAKSGPVKSGAKSGPETKQRRRGPASPSTASRAMPVRPVRRALLYGGAITLAIAIAAFGTAAASGVIPRLLVYAAAVAGWIFLWNNSDRMKKMQVAMLGVVLCAIAVIVPLVDPPQLAVELEIGRNVLASQVTPANSGGVAPFASALLAGWAAIGGGFLARRVLGATAILASGWLLWDKDQPRRSVGVMSFPLFLIEGIVYARLEVIAAALLVAAVVATIKRRYGLSALNGVLASGVTIGAIAGLPVLYGAAWHVMVWLGAAAVTLVLPKIILPSVTGWTTSLSSLASSSPILSFLNGRIASILTEWGVIDVLNAFSKAITTRAGTAARLVSPEVLATLIIVIALFVAISVIAARAETLEAAMADGIGLFLILAMTRDAALWVLVAPFAITSARRLWLLVAICSPILLFATGDARSSQIVWAISLAVPIAGFVALKLQKEAAPPKPAVA